MKRRILVIACLVLVGPIGCKEESPPTNPTGVSEPAATQPTTESINAATNGVLSKIQAASDDAIAFNASCPVTGEDVSERGGRVMYDGKVVGFCCKDCIDSFKSNPTRYISKAQ